jgi:hypothetical protein
VVSAVQRFFADGILPEDVNEIATVLIPKKSDPEELKDFRPISLCKVIFKVVSKYLVNRLRPMLQDIISPTQSAFIPGHLITDNAFVAFECIRAIQNGARLKRNYVRTSWIWLKRTTAWIGGF